MLIDLSVYTVVLLVTYRSILWVIFLKTHFKLSTYKRTMKDYFNMYFTVACAHPRVRLNLHIQLIHNTRVLTSNTQVLTENAHVIAYSPTIYLRRPFNNIYLYSGKDKGANKNNGYLLQMVFSREHVACYNHMVTISSQHIDKTPNSSTTQLVNDRLSEMALQ